MRNSFSILLMFLAAFQTMGQGAAVSPHPASRLEPASDIEEIPFAEAVKSGLGKKVIPLNPTVTADRVLIGKIGSAMDAALRQMNATGSSAQNERRVAGLNAQLEQAMKIALNAVPGLVCEFPKTASGKGQRMGYPSLRVEEQVTRRVVYLEPKLHHGSIRGSAARAFSFELKREGNKILEDAHHLVVAVEYEGTETSGWRFKRWELADLSRFPVKTRVELQGNSRDLYRTESIVGKSK